MLFHIFLPNWKNLCVCPLQNLSYSCVKRENDKESGVGEKVTHTSSRGKKQKAATRAHANAERSVCVFVCLFGEFSEGTWSS